MNISTKLLENLPDIIGEESFHFSQYIGNNPAPWQSYFETNQYGFKESHRVTQGTFLQNYWKKGQTSSEEKIFKTARFWYINMA